MHNKKLPIFFVALLVTVQATEAKQSWPLIDFDDIEKFIDQQFEQYDQRIRDMNNAKKQPTLTIAIPAVTSKATIPLQPLSTLIEETDEYVVISIKEIDSQEIDARLNDENTVLTICTSQEKIEIEVENNYIQIQTHQEQSKSTIGQSVSGDPQLGNQTIDYDPTSYLLTITIAKQTSEKQGKPVPVTIRQSDKDGTENED